MTSPENRPERHVTTAEDVRALASTLDIQLLDGEAEQIAPELGIALALARRLRNSLEPADEPYRQSDLRR